MAQGRKKNRAIVWVVALLLVVAAVAVGAVVWRKNQPKEETGTTSSTTVVAPTEPKEEKEEEKPSEVTPVEEKKEVQQYEGENPNKNATLTGVISYAGLAGDTVRIRVNIDQYLDSGACRLVLMWAGQVAYEETAKIVDSAATSTCEGFDIPASKLAVSNYDVVVYLTADGKTGEIHGEVSL